MSYEVLEGMLASAVLAGIPLAYAALGELLSERVGVINIGIEGVMLVGAAVGFVIAVDSGSTLIGFLASALAGGAFAGAFVALPIVFGRAPQIVIGFAAWFIGIGLSGEVAASYTSRALPQRMAEVHVPLLRDLPLVGKPFFEAPWPVYLGVVLVLLVAFLLHRTRHGMNLRAIGEDPGSAHAAGVPVVRWQLVYVTVGGALMGLGGGMLSLVTIRHWQDQMVAGGGWIALALVIFVAWRPVALLWGAYFFGILLVLGDVGQSQGWGIPSPILDMAPYLLTIAVLIARATRTRRWGGPPTAPAALGSVFVRGQR
ncbi:MAG: ral nucleoside transport system permease protein [Thermoleophilaceae bacterium]|nr:ral nucleoside transport system permease protein [Thermoleophilaceae bacterium]MEA2400170.1 ral nucleoside transport system permease protein [Thermoleophilaceae bacterium]MEA2454907.1 ral nucleoside transport system permease protein [Thermoleophilaceae bacterium]